MNFTRIKNSFAVAVAGAVSIVPQCAGAQTPSYAIRGETITGTIASIQNVNHLFIADDRGYTDDVTLRAGAVIMSNGLQLEPGNRVSVVGKAAGPTFLASRIATSGHRSSAASARMQTIAQVYEVPVYYPAPAYYAAPVYYPPLYPASVFLGGYSGFSAFYRGYQPGFFGYGRFDRPFHPYAFGGRFR